MNRIATATLATVLATAAMLGAWRAGMLGRQYADVVRATPVTVREPRYADVVDVVPVTRRRLRGRALAYDVAYRVGNRVMSTRVAAEPGDQIRVGEQHRVIGYDVAWRWHDRTGVVRMSKRPGRHLPVEDGVVVEGARPARLSG